MLAIEIRVFYFTKTQPWTCSSLHDKLGLNRPRTGEDMFPPPFFFTSHKIHLVDGLMGLCCMNYLQDSEWLISVSLYFSTSHKVHLIDGLHNPGENNSRENSKRPNFGSLWTLFQKKRSRKDTKFGTQHLRNPRPSGHHQPNELQQIQSHTRRNTTHKVHLVDGLVGLDYTNYLQDSEYLISVSCVFFFV